MNYREFEPKGSKVLIDAYVMIFYELEFPTLDLREGRRRLKNSYLALFSAQAAPVYKPMGLNE